MESKELEDLLEDIQKNLEKEINYEDLVAYCLANAYCQGSRATYALMFGFWGVLCLISIFIVQDKMPFFIGMLVSFLISVVSYKSSRKFFKKVSFAMGMLERKEKEDVD